MVEFAKSTSEKPSLELNIEVSAPEETVEKEEPEFEIAEDSVEEKSASTQENYDPTLDLGSYKYPTLDLMDEYQSGKAQVSKEELEQNKDKIVETLINFKIGISNVDERLHDLIISIDPNQVEIFKKELLKYLKVFQT